MLVELSANSFKYILFSYIPPSLLRGGFIFDNLKMKRKKILSRLPNMAFLCGANKSDSMRSKFLNYVQSEYNHVFVSEKPNQNIFSNERVILAEEVEKQWGNCLKEEHAGYDNLLEFEMDIAELASVIPIFLEGTGAMVETGAFFCNPKLRKKILIILDKKYCNEDSFIQRAIIKELRPSGQIICYDSKDKDINQKIYKKIFSFRNNEIDTQEHSQSSFYFYLLKFLCEWKTKEEIIEELVKINQFTKYKDKLDDHLKILTALGLIIEELDSTQTKFLSLLRADILINKDISDPFTSIKSILILLKYMRMFTNSDHFAYSYHKKYHKVYKKPDEQLDTLQKLLKTRILEDRDIFPIHEVAMAYVKKTNIRINAEKHCNNQYILKMDFKYFFNSIKRSDFLKYLKNKQKFNEYIEFICDILFKDESVMEEDFSLPIGSSSSPIVSNILLYSFDEKISSYCNSLGITYTRYADDMTFSHNQPNKLHIIESKLTEVLKEIPYPSNLQINNKKTVHMSKKGRRKVTGLILTPEGKISIGRNKKNYIKKLLRDYEKKDINKTHIEGYLNFINDVDKEFWECLCNKYKNRYKELFKD